MTNEISAADLLLAGRNNNDNYGMNGMGGWLWIIVLMLFWNRGGWGGYGNDGGTPVTEAQLCTSMNFNDLQNAVARTQDKIDRTQEGLATMGYEQLRTAMTAQAQQQDCCCTTNRNIDQLRYDMEKGFCETNNLITTLAKDNEIAALKQQVSAMQFNDLRNDLTCQIQAATANVVRYPSGYTYSAGNSPFCSCGTCGNNF